MAKGFNRPKGMKMPSGAPNMMQQLQKMQEQMESVQQELASETITGSAGGGVVKVMMSGEQSCKGVEIDPEILNDMDVEMLQDLIMTAINISLEKSRELQSEKMGPITGGLSGIMPPGLGF